MSNSIRLTLYTQNACPYCDMMKTKLEDWGFTYQVVNIKENKNALMFIKNEGHKTVPQLYWNRTHLNKCDTIDLTKKKLEEAIDYDNYVGGVEQWR